MKKKGFTLVELLVVIAIIALLMSILMPALSKVRQIAYRIVCGSNLTGIGKSMLVYAQDNDEQFPISGVPNMRWALMNGTQYKAANRKAAFGSPGPSGKGSVTSCFFLLVKFADVQVKQFICRGDEGSAPFTPSLVDTPNPKEISEYWDFGPTNTGAYKAAKACSYSYHMPFMTTTNMKYSINASSQGNLPLCSDRSPYYDINANEYRDGKTTGEQAPSWNSTDNAYVDLNKSGNAAAHQRDGQNVLFQDTHVDFARYPNVGINNDNIFKVWTGSSPYTSDDKEVGAASQNTYSMENAAPQPKSKEDTFMISEIN